jgi:hypothetical protein
MQYAYLLKVSIRLTTCGCGGIGIRARLRGVWLCLASSSLAIRIHTKKGLREISQPFLMCTRSQIPESVMIQLRK